MTLFEYLTAAVSIVLALAVVRLVEGLRPALESGKRYWVHWGWVLAKIVSCLVFWWSLWGSRGAVPWNFLYFAFVFVGPIILYVQASALVPQNPTNVASWREHFLSVHRPFYVANLLYLVHLGVTPSLLLGEPIPMRGLAVVALGCAASLAGALLASQRAQEIIAPIMFATIALATTTLLLEPLAVQVR